MPYLKHPAPHVLFGLVCVFIILYSVFFTATGSQLNMNFRARDDTWLLQLDKIFNEDPVLVSTSGDRDSRELSNKLKLLLSKRTKIWWNKAFLTKYISRGMIPRGLRVQVFPSFETENDEFKQKWEKLADICSMGFMDLLVQSNSNTLVDLEKEIEELQSTLKRDFPSETIAKIQDDLDKDYLKWEKDICAIKSGKFQRDSQDYLSNKVYKWRMRQGRSRSRSFSHSRSSSVSSRTSGDEGNKVRDLNTNIITGTNQGSFGPRRQYDRNVKQKNIRSYQQDRNPANKLER
ncbi:uncharacterized protein LOC142663820 [Rhinoderma darwinii]|uniref:uncharacterized protein LOC142663820 n=1 Tax=Rhinoderma darwinii TaxID=43563 RepID=UPI003F6610BB